MNGQYLSNDSSSDGGLADLVSFCQAILERTPFQIVQPVQSHISTVSGPDANASTHVLAPLATKLWARAGPTP